MNVLLFTIGSHGDVHPFVGIGRALRARGHSVRLITNDYFEPLARAAGLDFTALGTRRQFLELIEDPDLWHPRRGFDAVFLRGVLPVMEEAYRAIESNTVPGQTVMVAHSLGFAARIAQEKLNIPTATAHISPAVMRTVHDVPKLPGLFMPNWMPKWLKRKIWAGGDRWFLDRKLKPAINEFRQRLGLDSVSGILDRWWHSPQRVLALWPSWYGPIQPDWPEQVRCVGFPLYDEAEITPLEPELDQWLQAGAPPIAFTPGSAMVQGRDFFQTAADACEVMNRRGLLLTRHPAQLPRSLPPGVRHVEYAPFGALLPRCAALVHHGGMGTTAQALRAATPQLIVPMAHDQFDNALRVQRLGAGRWIRRRHYRTRNLAAQLAGLLSDQGIQAACRSLKQRFEGVCPLDEICGAIEQLSIEHSGVSQN